MAWNASQQETKCNRAKKQAPGRDRNLNGSRGNVTMPVSKVTPGMVRLCDFRITITEIGSTSVIVAGCGGRICLYGTSTMEIFVPA